MRLALLSDVHANFEALTAVLADSSVELELLLGARALAYALPEVALFADPVGANLLCTLLWFCHALSPNSFLQCPPACAGPNHLWAPSD